MALNLSSDCTFTGPALPEPFVKFNLEAELNRLALLPKATGADARALDEQWHIVRRKFRELVSHGGGLRVQNHVIEPLIARLGYARIEAVETVQTREGDEEGGALLVTEDSAAKLRVWCVDLNADLDAPARRGLAYRFSQTRIAQRVLLATGERLGILTNGVELRLLISDPARVDSQLAISIDPHWKRSREVPDSLRLLIALASPAGVKALPELIDKARLQQAKVTKDLREQARHAVREFIQELIDHPDNQTILAEYADKTALAKDLWHEGLITVYRLLFILKLESTDDPARSFSFASTSLWRNTFSPTVALAPIVRRVLDQGAQTGRLLQDGLRALFRMLSDGLQCTELNVRPMAGALFAPATTPILGRLYWSETAIAKLLDNLLWTRSARGATARERVHYGPLDVEDLGRVYEALLELEPGITSETMCRLRRAKLEVVVPAAQGERYKPEDDAPATEPTTLEIANDDADEPEEEEEPGRGKKTKVEWIEEILPNNFYLRVGLGRKATGSFYTPHSFVRFLVRETLGPLVQRVSPADDPQPCAILKLKVIDKAMGSGHFLVEACRFLGEALYDAARRCDELAAAAEKLAESYRASAKTKPEHQALAAEQEARAAMLRQRVIDLPDPDDELLRYLPSRSVEGTAGGVSHNKAIALCRRMVAVHCLYGVDKNPLAVELAKLALWIECHAEGLPLTFLDHRLVIGDSLTGPFFEHLLKYPGAQQPLDDLFTRGLTAKLTAALADALQHVRALEATVGVTVADIEAKQAAKTRLDRALAPFKILAAAWSGGVMLGPEGCDDTAYAALAKHIAENGNLPEDWLTAFGNHAAVAMLKMVVKGLGLPAISENVSDFHTLTTDLNKNAIPALSFDLAFPEVFYPDGNAANRAGFDADLGNPPWDKLRVERRELLGSLDINFLLGKEFEGAGLTDRQVRQRLEQFPLAREIEGYCEGVAKLFATAFAESPVVRQVIESGGDADLYRLFTMRASEICSQRGQLGLVLGGGAAKNPTDAGLRRYLFARFPIKTFVHYLNLKQLFDGATSRMGFTLVGSCENGNDIRLERDLITFDELVRSPLMVDAAVVRENLSTTGSPFSASIRGTGRSLPSFLSSLGVDLGTDLHRTKETGSLVEVASIVENALDGRLPEVRAELVSRGHLVTYQGRSMQQYNHLPLEKAGKWNPEATLAISMAACGSDLAHRSAFYRLAVRATPGHPKTNARSAVACFLPPGSLATNSLLVETNPQQRPNAKALLALAVLNSKVTDFQIRPHVQANLNQKLMEQCQVAALDPSVCSTLVHCALGALQGVDMVDLRLEQNLPREVQFQSDPRVLIDVLLAKEHSLSREQFEKLLLHFSRQEAARPEKESALTLFDELAGSGLTQFLQRHDPYHACALIDSLPAPAFSVAAVPQDVGKSGARNVQADFGLEVSPTPKRRGRKAEFKAT